MAEPVISSAHLAQSFAALSEFEFSLNLAASAYSRWIARCAAAAGASLSSLEVLVIHTVRHRERPKRLAEIILVLDIDDTHIATYALRKLEKLGLLRSRREGKEKVVEVTAEGRAFCDRYAALREQLLVGSATIIGLDETELSQVAGMLRSLSGQYNQAARAAATM